MDARLNAVDFHYHAAPVVGSLYGVLHRVNAQVGQRQFLQQRVTVGRSLLLRFSGINGHAVGLADHLGPRYRGFAQRDGRFLILCVAVEEGKEKNEE